MIQGIVSRVSPLAASFLAGLFLASSGSAQTEPRVGGYLQIRETYQEASPLSVTLNRARLSADGSLPARFSYRLLIELEAPGGARTPAGVSLRDAYARWNPAPWSLWLGQFKTPFSREYLTSITAIELADRPAVVDTLAPKRDIGLMIERSFGVLATLSAGVFNGEGQNVTANRDSAVLWVARVVVRPLPEVTLAAAGALYGSDSTRYGVEAHLERRGWLMRAELIGQDAPSRRRDDLGWYVLAGYRFLPWLQVIARQEDFQRPSIGVERRISASTAGVNVDLPGGKARLLANVVSRYTGFPRARRYLVIGQVQVRF